MSQRSAGSCTRCTRANTFPELELTTLRYFILNTQPEIDILKVLYIYLLPLLKGALLLSVTKWVARYRVTSFDTRYDDTISDLISRFIMTLYDRRPDQTVFFYYVKKNPNINNNILYHSIFYMMG